MSDDTPTLLPENTSTDTNVGQLVADYQGSAFYQDGLYQAALPYYILGTPLTQGKIDTVHPQLAAAAYHVRRMRDVMAGEHVIKGRGTTYLPLSRNDQDIQEYERLKYHTNWFPATNRTAAGIKGLLFAKNVVLNAPALEPIKNVITRELASVRDLAEQAVSETLVTNFTGLLVDHPSVPKGVTLNAENALSLGFRPYVTLYTMESIIWIDYGNQDNARKPIRVVLRDGDDINRILELSLTTGIYQQTVWCCHDGVWAVDEVRTPTRDGQPLNRLPFTIVSDNTHPWPQPSVLRDVADLNLQHYIQSSKIANLEMIGAGLVPVVSGIKFVEDPLTGGKAPPADLDFATGAWLVLEDPQATARFLEPHGHLADTLKESKADLQDQLSKCGARIIATEKVAPEAAETVARRAASEDATNASLAIIYQRRISDAISWCSWWIDGSVSQFTLNTDYRNHTMSADERVIALAEVEAGAVSRLAYYMERRDNGVVNSSDTFDEEQARIAQDMADRPPVQTGL